MSPVRVLIVDDEPQLLRALRINLQARQYEVVTAADGTAALQAAAAEHPDVVVLDLGLPDLDGIEVLRTLRSWTPVPVLVLSGRLGSSEKVAALDAGADDYVTKPFNIDELLARIRSIIRRRPEPEAVSAVRIGDYEIDLVARDARRADGTGGRQHLTRTEWLILDLLARNPGKLIGHRELLQHVWGPTYLDQTHYLRQYIGQLRRKLESDPARPRHLLTEPAMGYRFQP
ncbi:response regulator [Dactylosporangium sucinum]|uniref:Transcriptional regulatory protein KdpE n=1 Tax=Dactylosporangium sucinum TaxID=1424081 RepID=A0A917TND6_9ACTN|nr:response regulator [Dactylosporangium sucinum]GGM27300.1 putative transcriptional regulatory protein KdpE [Dactylosporangium sucinum]